MASRNYSYYLLALAAGITVGLFALLLAPPTDLENVETDRLALDTESEYGRAVGEPSNNGARLVGEPSNTTSTDDAPDALANVDLAADNSPHTPERSESAPSTAVITGEAPPVLAAPTSESVQIADAASVPSRPTPELQESPVATRTPAPTAAPPSTTQPAAAAPTTTRPQPAAAAPTTTRPPTAAAPNTTRAPAAAAVVAPVANAAASGPWVDPSETGHRLGSLHDFPPANDGPHGVTITAAFLRDHANAPWLSWENNSAVITGINADGLCLNITIPLTLRDSYINCPTRTQNDSWGYAGQQDVAPAVNIHGANNVTIEHNTITCSGSDANICGRNIRIGGRNATIEYNDLSLARGAVEVFHDTIFRNNYIHSLAYGFDPSRANNPTDNITHNNVVNNFGYQNVLVQGNYIEAFYGRVSTQPNTYLYPWFRGVYEGGVVEVGDPMNGFAFINYLVNGNGNNYRIIENYIEGSGRPFRCNQSSRYSNPSCAADISRNVFANHYFDEFGITPLFDDKDGNGTINGSCNVAIDGGSTQTMASAIFGSSGTHRTTNC